METQPLKRAVAQVFDPPQTWYRFLTWDGSIEPVDGVYRATRTQVQANHRHGNNITYYRSETFPTYEEAATALADALLKIKEKQVEAAKKAEEEIEATQKLIDTNRHRRHRIVDRVDKKPKQDNDGNTVDAEPVPESFGVGLTAFTDRARALLDNLLDNLLAKDQFRYDGYNYIYTGHREVFPTTMKFLRAHGLVIK